MSNQFHIHSVDTSAFYNEKEYKIHRQLIRLYRLRKEIKDKIDQTKESSKDTLDKLKLMRTRCNKLIKFLKNKLIYLFTLNNKTRILNESTINKNNVISIFESTLSRILGIQKDELSEELIVVRVYFFEILKDIVTNGFFYKGNKYIYFSSSAGQIRTKKAIFIKEESMKKHGDTLMCGLTIDKINELGGVNTNKFMAYLSLSNSATDRWENFNIDKCIVVDDMETMVETVVDFIDEKTFEIQRKKMKVPITHTDGAGMILPSLCKKNFMVRLPWIKGLLCSFPFDKFIKNNKHCNGKIKDVYGKEWDIIKDGIEIIFTKSQFKMSKYYSSWDDYKDNFKKFNCEAGICNMEEDIFPNAKLNYQMLQTLSDMTDNELQELSKKTVDDILKIGSDRNTMLKVLGVTDQNVNKNYFQQALEIYPELLADTYSRERLKDVKKSLIKHARAAKLEVDGKYTFVIPDMFAFCQFLFLGDKNPSGLLKSKQVFCKLYKDKVELDCLRSPHLYREHAIRTNVVDNKLKGWFITNGIYTSVHDAISKVLMFDNDGDRLLVCAEKVLVDVAKRNMKGVVPLYYNMAAAGKERIDSKTLYNGLVNAYTGGNIGIISNNITKVWNSSRINLDVIKWLCLINNFVIDYAKTLYKPQQPKHIEETISSYTKSKVPQFFIYAKNKKEKNVSYMNNSVVNRLYKHIPKPILRFTATNLGKFDYKLLMNDPDVKLNDEIINKYKELDLGKRFTEIEPNADDFTGDNIFIYTDIRRKLLEVDYNLTHVVDVLVKYLYGSKNSSYKTTLWSSFGDVIVKNLYHNLKTRHKKCKICGEEILVSGKNHQMCSKCWKEHEKERQRLKWHKYKDKYRNSATVFNKPENPLKH